MQSTITSLRLELDIANRRIRELQRENASLRGRTNLASDDIIFRRG